jgi:hypothetical protein
MKPMETVWIQERGPTNPRTLELDSVRMRDLSLDYTRQAEALREGRTQDVCHSVALYLQLAADTLGTESAQLRRYPEEPESA